MKPINIKQHLIPIYLAMILLILVPISFVQIIHILVPLIILSVGIHFNRKQVSLAGIFLFYFLSIPQLKITTIDNPVQVYSITFLILLPSLLLLSQILQNHRIEEIHWVLKNRGTPVMLAIGAGVLLLLLFYGIAAIAGSQIIFSTEAAQGQVLLLTGLSLLIFTPLLIKQTPIWKKQDETFTE